jgi:hypothetical protein
MTFRKRADAAFVPHSKRAYRGRATLDELAGEVVSSVETRA